ncbi:uncharacterized protein F4822DRAFT_339695 [Hypoxylon trugodes]|uniref:uncharacterized protein n=1 Tax=Hypoxylon trugodes TaxID=326681 RepID=UPI0021992C5C|nr:uncharacterized protein F4822DRAFT_339695 [Hypoxylon trugodes]KAI1385275.1 hypothetical protein F4822DRAFT_339695 [Hypoxylon trugodes]
MQALPFFQVSDLPPSASFFAAVAQPLGLKYISANSSSIVFGDTNSPTPEPIFEVKQRIGPDAHPPQPCRLVLSATSPSVVSAFHAAALRSNPDLKECGPNINYLHIQDNSDPNGESRARVSDFDGNIMEVVHGSTPDYATSQVGSTVRRTQSSSHEVSRVLDWNLDVAPSRSVVGSATASSTVGSRASNGDPLTVLRKSVTTTSTVESSPRENPQGLTSTVFGTVLGVAVGAAVGGALTYSMMKDDRERMAFQEYEQPPAFARRSTFPDPYPTNQPRYYPPASFAGGPRSRVVEELDDRASRHSSQYTTGSRTRSEASSARRPLMIADHEYKSNAGSSAGPKYGDAPRLLMDAEHRSVASSRHTAADNHSQAGSRYTTASSRRSPESDYRSYASSKYTSTARPRDPEVETYISARSDRSASTIRPAPASVETAPPSRAPSKAGSRFSSSTVRGPNRAPSHVSARNVPQPESVIGGGRGNWEDDVDSVAPSDSISNVGSRSSRRSQRV